MRGRNRFCLFPWECRCVGAGGGIVMRKGRDQNNGAKVPPNRRNNMKFSKNWKRFFTLDRCHAEGFTLIELIVVIAILAILAGIAVPAYSGYIEKANKAADQQLLSALNTAFAAACVKEGTDISKVEATTGITPEETWTGKAVTGVNIYNDSFLQFYGDNVNAEFKVIEDLTFVNGMFVDGGEVQTFSYTNSKGVTSKISLTTAQLTTLQNSIIAQQGAAGIMDSVGNLYNLLGATGDNGASLEDQIEVVLGENYLEVVAGYMGTDAATLEGKLISGDISETDLQNYMMNAAVLEIAKTADNMSTEDVTSYLKTGEWAGSTVNEKAAQAALMYGLYSAYYEGNVTVSPEEGYVGLLKQMQEDDDFKNSVTQDDIDAYLTALSVVSGNSSNTDVTSDLIVNGFDSKNESNDALIGMLNGMLGIN